MIVKTVKIDDVLKNPYRDFNNYPLDQEQVARLKESMSDGLWHPLPVRRLGNLFELAFGHHRVEALRQMGETEVRVAINDFSDSDMVRLMVQENATQRGNSLVAALDSIAAITRFLAAAILSSENLVEFNQVVNSDQNCSLFDSEKAFSHAKGHIKAGNAIGRKIISRYIGETAFSDKQIQDAVGVLKDTGQLKEIFEDIAFKLQKQEEAMRLEAERIEREAKERQEAEQRRIEAEEARKRREAEEARERAIQRAKNAEARKLAEAEAKRKRDEARAQREAQEREARAAREAANKRAEAKRLQERRLRAEADKAKMAAQEQREQRVDVEAISLFKTESHARLFRRFMAKEEVLKVFPVAMHYKVAKKAIEIASNMYTPTGQHYKTVELTEGRVETALHIILRQGLDVKQSSFNTVAEKIETNAPHLKTERVAKEARYALRDATKSLDKMVEQLIAEPETLEKAWFDIKDLRDQVITTMTSIKQLQILFTTHKGWFPATDKEFMERDLLQIEDRANMAVTQLMDKYKAKN